MYCKRCIIRKSLIYSFLASLKFEINGSTLVLERNGTPIQDDQVLVLLKNEPIILLTQEETWQSQADSERSRTSCCSTVTASTSSSIETSSSVLLENNTEFVWSNFNIPWEKIPKDIISRMEKGQISKEISNAVIHSVIYEMRQVKTRIPSIAFKYAAKKIVDKYPESFRDIDIDGIVIGDGTHSITSKLIDRNNYLNRPHKRGLENWRLCQWLLKGKKPTLQQDALTGNLITLQISVQIIKVS